MAELSDSLSMAFLVLLESLTPVERAVFLLREVFDYSHQDIAQIVDKNEVNCRQIFTRARQHINSQHPRYEASTEQSEVLLQSFLAATREGNIDQLTDLLAADAAFYGDGGGKTRTIREPLFGQERIATVLVALFDPARPLGFEPILVNSGPGIITRDREGKIVNVLSLEVLDGRIQTVRSVVNPDKL